MLNDHDHKMRSPTPEDLITQFVLSYIVVFSQGRQMDVTNVGVIFLYVTGDDVSVGGQENRNS